MAAIDTGDDALDLDLPARGDGDLGDLTDDGAERLVDRDAAADAFWRRLSPVALLRERIQYGEEVWFAHKKRAPVFDRIAFSRMGALVDEALDREGVLRRADRTPEHDRHMGVFEV